MRLDKPNETWPADMELVELKIARHWFPRRRGRKLVSMDTLYRWCQRGLKDGRKLQAVKSGGDWFTCKKWVDEFNDSGRPNEQQGSPRFRSSSKRARDAKWAADEFRRIMKSPPSGPNQPT